MQADPLAVDPPQPVCLNSGHGAWVLSRYSDVLAALRDPRLVAGNVDEQWHREYRESAALTFSGPALTSWTVEMESCARGLLPKAGSIEIVEDFAKPFANFVAKLVLGESKPEAFADAAAVFAAAAEPFNAELQSRAGESTQRLAADMSVLHMQAFVALTQSVPAFLANSVFAVVENGVTPTFDSPALEELLRYAGPSKAQLRSCKEAVNVHDVTIQPGDRVLLSLASANRDANVFPNPDRLDLTRTPNKHLAFGAGSHSCLGSALVRTASSIALRVLFETQPDMQLQSWDVRPGLALRAMQSVRASISKLPHPGPH